MSSTQSSQLVIFGGTGDLALRKLQPALYKLQREGLIDDVRAIIALGRGESILCQATFHQPRRKQPKGLPQLSGGD